MKKISSVLTLLIRGDAKNLVNRSLQEKLRRRLRRVLVAAGQEAGMCLSLVDDREIHDLNRIYAGEDHATDVLSFSQRPIAEALEEVTSLGDVIVSVQTAQRQADALGRSLQDELLHLAVHGFCHLLGYDHATPEEERDMFAYEAFLRTQANKKSTPECRLPSPFLH